jgi:hypothetical protein
MDGTFFVCLIWQRKIDFEARANEPPCDVRFRQPISLSHESDFVELPVRSVRFVGGRKGTDYPNWFSDILASPFYYYVIIITLSKGTLSFFFF